MDADEVWRAIATERRQLADFLEGISPAEWDVPSLCAGWRVRDVAAHVTMSARQSPLDSVFGFVRAGLSFNRYVDRAARREGTRPVEEIVAFLREIADSRRHPFFTSRLDPLVDVLVHSQDIARPLGRRLEMPVAPARAAIGRVWAVPYPYGARRRIRGFRLTTTDSDWSGGRGLAVNGPTEDVLLVLSGRLAGLDGLDGPGLTALREKLGVAA